MDELLYHSDILLEQLSAYEAALMLEEQTNYYIRRFAAPTTSSQDENNNFSSLKISVANGIRYIYDQCRFQTWQDIQNTKAILLQLAEKTGYSDMVLPSIQDSLPQQPLSIEDDSIASEFLDFDGTNYRQD